MLITFGFFASLFIVGLLTTIFNFPTRKFSSLLHSFFPQTTPSPLTNKAPSMAQNKVIKTGSSTQNKTGLKSIFATFDKNKDGFITKQELSESLKNIGMSMSERDVVEIVEKADFNNDGLIDFDEFVELMGSQDHEEIISERELDGGKGDGDSAGEGELKEAFDVFDGDRDGLITVEELGLVLNSLGFKEGKKLEDCKEMIRQVDVDGDGMVNFDEFKSMMRCGARLIPVS